MKPESKALIEEWILPAGHNSGRADQLLTIRYPSWSRSQIKSHIAEGRFTINGKIIKASYLLKAGDIVHFYSEYSEIGLVPEDIPLDILFEDEHLMVINKPSDMACHPGLGIFKNTVLNGLAFYYIKSNQPTALTNGLVHRLDKGTSGLLAIAKNIEAFHHLSYQFATKMAKRTYIALVWGHPENEHGTIDVAIGRDILTPKIIRPFVNEEGGKDAKTHYQVLKKYAHYSLMQFELETGRTHQVRIHSHYIGCPIVKDQRYKKILTQEEETILSSFPETKGIFLQAKELRLIHPFTKTAMEFIIDIPQNWEVLL
jgi:23S rRNA pseudouridine1911/1915/1917 synthase